MLNESEDRILEVSRTGRMVMRRGQHTSRVLDAMRVPGIEYRGRCRRRNSRRDRRRGRSAADSFSRILQKLFQTKDDEETKCRRRITIRMPICPLFKRKK